MKACPGLRSGIDGSNSLSLIIRDISWSLRPLNSSFSRTRESRGGVRASTRNSLVENNANDKPRNMSATQSVALGLVPSLGRTARSPTLHRPASHHFHPLMRPSQGHGDSRDQKHAPYPDTGPESREGTARRTRSTWSRYGQFRHNLRSLFDHNLQTRRTNYAQI